MRLAARRPAVPCSPSRPRRPPADVVAAAADLGRRTRSSTTRRLIVSARRRRARRLELPGRARQRRPRRASSASRARPARPRSAPSGRSCSAAERRSAATTSPGVAAFGAPARCSALTAPGRAGAAAADAARRALRPHERDASAGRVDDPPRAVPARIAGVALSVNARGDAALAWFEDRGVRTDRVYVALRRAGHGVRPAAAARHRAHPRRGGGDRRRAATCSWRGMHAACCAPASSRAGARSFRATRHDPLRGRLLRRDAPGRHAVRARRAGLERPVPERGRLRGPDLLPGRRAAVRRDPVPRAPRCSTVLAGADGESAARSTRRSTRPGSSRSPGPAGSPRQRARRAHRRRRTPAPAAGVSPARDRGAALRPRRRSGRPPDRRLGRRRSRTAQSLVAAAVAPGAGAPFGPPEAVSPAGRDGAAARPSTASPAARRSSSPAGRWSPARRRRRPSPTRRRPRGPSDYVR